jgi:alginate O-acetyltransferase complex protein AlgI
MLFASVEYLVFLPIVVALYWAAPSRFRNALLLVASYVFYMSFVPIYGALIFGLALANYGLGLWIARTSRPKAVLALAIALDLGVLAFFKYTNFFVGEASRLAGADASWFTLQVILPLGISFFTFEFVHYVVDIYRGSVPIHDFTNFHLFASFFPSQIAGPIKRFQPFNAQLRPQPPFDAVLFEEGIWLIARGLAKKVALADQLGPLVATAFTPGATPSQVSAWAGAYAFALQIFFDFSGYTDIGRGSAQLLGFRLPQNFAIPYLARGMRDFWQRWHMSLSSWLRDYLYIPLGGNRGGGLRTAANLMVTMGLGGLWHGAAGHFVVWGLFHGGLLVGERVLTAATPSALRRAVQTRIGQAVSIVVTLQLVTVGWVLFRAPSLADATAYLRAMLGLERGGVSIPFAPVAFAAAVYAFALLGERIAPSILSPAGGGTRMWPLRSAALAAMLVATLALVPQTVTRFIYFQF